MAAAPKEGEGQRTHRPATKESLGKARYDFRLYDTVNTLKPQAQPEMERIDPPKKTLVWEKIAEGKVAPGGHVDAKKFLVRYDGPIPTESGVVRRKITLIQATESPARQIIARLETDAEEKCRIKLDGLHYKITAKDAAGEPAGSGLVEICVYAGRQS